MFTFTLVIITCLATEDELTLTGRQAGRQADRLKVKVDSMDQCPTPFLQNSMNLLWQAGRQNRQVGRLKTRVDSMDQCMSCKTA